jgi:hypothetical protein
MEKEFIPYEQALALKPIGFNKPCFKKYIAGCLWSNPITPEIYEYENIHPNSSDCLAPLYQQAFKWFREKYNLNYVIVKADSWFYTINGCNTQEGFKTYKEAENACLNKLIEIVKK